MSRGDYHCRSRLFSLIGRPVVLNDDWNDYPGKPINLHGVIIEKKPGKMRFLIDFGGHAIWYDRADFKLPPLHPLDRPPEWLRDNFDGFVYAGVEGF
jgi:hypothetical protein